MNFFSFFLLKQTAKLGICQLYMERFLFLVIFNLEFVGQYGAPGSAILVLNFLILPWVKAQNQFFFKKKFLISFALSYFDYILNIIIIIVKQQYITKKKIFLQKN